MVTRASPQPSQLLTSAIAAVEAQPSQRNHPMMMNFFMIFRWAVMIIMIKHRWLSLPVVA
jgi:hypothetical protein